MNPLRLSAALLVLFFAGMPPLAAQDKPTSHVWLLRDGSKMTGSFVKLLADKLIIKENNKEVVILIDWLAPSSFDVAKALAGGMEENLVETVMMMEFTYVSGAKLFPDNTFDMGAPKETTALQEFEPYHRVKISRPFYLKQTEVTWAEWNAVRALAKNKSYSDIAPGRNGYMGDISGNHPVTEVSWWDAIKWCNLKSQIEGKTPVYYTDPDDTPKKVLPAASARATAADTRDMDFTKKAVLKTGSPQIYVNWDADGYRLPTEAEWELAWHCGGRCKGMAEPDGWHNEISEANTHPVQTMASATAKPIHDMLGNVAEWCWDWWGPLVPFSFEADPRGPASGPHRVVRGGSWADNPWCCRPTYRGDYSPVPPRSCFLGFRPARNASR